MKNTYEILPEQSLVHITVCEHPTYEEWEKMMREIFADPQFRPGFDFLSDKRGADAAGSTEHVEAVAHFYIRHEGKMGRWAIVVQGLLAFGMTRMTESYCGGDRVRAFTDMDEAMLWIHAGQPARVGSSNEPSDPDTCGMQSVRMA